MQFKKAQRAELLRTWNQDSWFYYNLSVPARQIIEHAYGLRPCSPKTRTKCQEDVTLALALFSDKIGCDKAHACHALLSGSVQHLVQAIERLHGSEASVATTPEALSDAWEASFRESNMGVFTD